MSQLAKQAREARNAKAKRLAEGGDRPVDASGYSPPGGVFDAEEKTGNRPITRQHKFKRGGKVEGDHAPIRADKTPRKGPKKSHYGNGGETGSEVPTERFGFHSGPSQFSRSMGLKTGGRAKRASGGDALAEALSPAYALAKNPKALNAISPISNLKKGGSVSDGEIQGTRPTGGRLARKSGGRTKGKTNINIVIDTGKSQAAQPPMMPPARPMPPPMPPMPPGPPPSMGPQGPMGLPPGLPPGGIAPGAPPPMPMPRKRGGRTMDAGAGSGLGRLEKTAMQRG